MMNLGVSSNSNNVFKTTLINRRKEFEDLISIKDDEDFFNLLVNVSLNIFILQEVEIIQKAINYTVDKKMIAVLEHIIGESSRNYLDMQIKMDVSSKD